MNGIEWVVEAHGCDPGALADVAKLRALFAQMIADLSLRPVGETQWHQFPALSSAQLGGVTGLCLLAESHLAVHTFPEHGSLCLNLFCCRPRDEWQFREYLAANFGAEQVIVRKLDRDYTSVTALAAAGAKR